MSIRKLERDQWTGFCQFASKMLLGRCADIESSSLEHGYRLEIKRLPLLGLEYDARRDLMVIALDGIEHMIREPRDIYVDESEGFAVEIVDAHGVHEIVVLHEPLRLPAPDGESADG